MSCPLRSILAFPTLFASALPLARAAEAPPTYRDANAPIDARVRDLVLRLTLEEKAGLMKNGNDGVARAGEATVFPQTIGLAAM